MQTTDMNHILSISPQIRNDAKHKENAFLDNFSLRCRNALVIAGIVNKSILEDAIATGNIFTAQKLGVSGIKEVVTWAWNQRSERTSQKLGKVLHLTIRLDDLSCSMHTGE